MWKNLKKKMTKKPKNDANFDNCEEYEDVPKTQIQNMVSITGTRR